MIDIATAEANGASLKDCMAESADICTTTYDASDVECALVAIIGASQIIGEKADGSNNPEDLSFLLLCWVLYRAASALDVTFLGGKLTAESGR